MNKYLFTSERIGFRKWCLDDFDSLFKLCSSEKVMKYFPKTLDHEQTQKFLNRLIDVYDEQGFVFYAIELLETGEFLGFTGLVNIAVDAFFTPSVEIGWRLVDSQWNKGLATEAANRCLEFGFTNLGLNEIVAYTTHNNVPSERVMIKIGMKKIGTFDHPDIAVDTGLNPMLVYRIKRKDWADLQ